MLPILPPVVIIIIASGIYAVRSFLGFMPKRGLSFITLGRWSLAILLIVGMFGYSLPLATAIHSEPAPVVQLVAFVRSNYDPRTTTIIVFHEYRAFQFYGKEFNFVHCCVDRAKAVAILAGSIGYDQVLITGSALRALSSQGIRLPVQELIEFYRNPLVKIEDHNVTLYRVLGVTS